MSPTVATINHWLPAEFGDTGVAVAIISGGQTRFYLHGFADHSKQQAVGKQTLFEIGSVTKPLVGLVTALLVTDQQLSLDTTVAALLQHADYQQHQYTLAQLLSHYSGLPRLPANLPLTDLTDPYANYSQADLMAALQQVQPGEQQFEYSNFGYGLLAELISRQQNVGFSAMMQQQLFNPLNMTASTVAITGGSYTNRAQGYQPDGTDSANWHFQALAGAGAVLSSIADMAKLVEHYLSATATDNLSTRASSNTPSLAKAMRLSVTPAAADPTIGFGWMLQPEGLIWHNGQTGGFNAFVGFAPAEQVGIIILSNATIPVTPGGMTLLQQLQQQANTKSNEQP
ncbi:serine hydrolase domain-containing protein [Arsukibacterium perlucidum]|uniref:serine hydrolase domain-containing protein n=1 Tax=Arsukibacterium perlucidum TaxID=368811 RepID=UPI0003742EA0|nr:serine hydrolase domain-containing protein [Arsukibacterium perlucidum]